MSRMTKSALEAQVAEYRAQLAVLKTQLKVRESRNKGITAEDVRMGGIYRVYNQDGSSFMVMSKSVKPEAAILCSYVGQSGVNRTGTFMLSRLNRVEISTAEEAAS